MVQNHAQGAIDAVSQQELELASAAGDIERGSDRRQRNRLAGGRPAQIAQAYGERSLFSDPCALPGGLINLEICWLDLHDGVVRELVKQLPVNHVDFGPGVNEYVRG